MSRTNLSWPLVLILVLGPIQWIRLVDVGLSIKLVHLPLVWITLMTAREALTGELQVRREAVRPATILFILYAAYLTILLASTVTSSTPGSGVTMIIKLSFQLALSTALFFHLARLNTTKIVDSLVVGAAIAATLFIVLIWFALASHGLSLGKLLISALTSGDPRPLQFKLFLALFNDGDLTAAGRTPASLRQVSLGFFFIGLVACVQRLLPGQREVRLRKTAGFGLGMGLLIIVLSMSRSFLLLTAILLLVALIPLLRSRASTTLTAIATVVAVAACAAGLGFLDGAWSIADARFGALQGDGRVLQFVASLDAIAEKPFSGHGAGYSAEFRHGQHNMVHNLILAAWVQAGVPGLVISLGLTVMLLATLGSQLWRTQNVPNACILPALLVLPILRSQLGGFGGNFAVAEILAISIALAVIQPNVQKRPVPRLKLVPSN